MRIRKSRKEVAAAADLEEALVDRLRQLDWPKPTDEVKQRCLDDILERMAEVQKEEPNRATRMQVEYRARGFGDRHALTRRAGVLSHRQPYQAPDRPVRVATVLW